jgi:hypothetical protein
MSSSVPETTVAETLAEHIVAVKPGMLPAETVQKCEDLLIDVIGLCVTARKEDYVLSAATAFDDGGISTVIGHRRTLSAAGAWNAPACRLPAKVDRNAGIKPENGRNHKPESCSDRLRCCFKSSRATADRILPSDNFTGDRNRLRV